MLSMFFSNRKEKDQTLLTPFKISMTIVKDSQNIHRRKWFYCAQKSLTQVTNNKQSHLTSESFLWSIKIITLASMLL